MQHPAALALARLAGAPPPRGDDPASAAAAAADAERVLSARLGAAAQLQKDVSELRRREAALQIQLANATLENVELRREVAVGWQLAEPNVRQMVLDPAVQREFDRLKSDLHESVVAGQTNAEKLAGMQYTQASPRGAAGGADSKMGLKLVAKCQQLLRENQELGAELAESKSGAVGRQLAVARGFAADLQAALHEMRDAAVLLEEEQEDLVMAAFLQKRRADDLEAQLAALRGGGGGGGSGAGQQQPPPPQQQHQQHHHHHQQQPPPPPPQQQQHAQHHFGGGPGGGMQGPPQGMHVPQGFTVLPVLQPGMVNLQQQQQQGGPPPQMVVMGGAPGMGAPGMLPPAPPAPPPGGGMGGQAGMKRPR
ncbi:MAG: hypothetical protein J3K34DRAFT_500443 [Monoraphidium minutum]|nr:MAG: hypothetical protein J3K34DRAFT_500443 [Monoraphidium minutum]